MFLQIHIYRQKGDGRPSQKCWKVGTVGTSDLKKAANLAGVNLTCCPPSMHRYLQGGARGAVVILLMLGKLHQGKERDEERHLTICICE